MPASCEAAYEMRTLFTNSTWMRLPWAKPDREIDEALGITIVKHFNGRKWVYQIRILNDYLRDSVGRIRSFATTEAAKRALKD